MDQATTTLMSQLLAGIKDQNIFTVSYNEQKQEIWIDFNLADEKFWIFLTQRNVHELYRVIVKLIPGKSVAQVHSEVHELVWSAGIPQLGFEVKKSFFKGTQLVYSKAVELKTTGEGFEVAYSYAFNSAPILAQTKSIVKAAGYKLQMDPWTKAGLIIAGVTLALLAVFGILAAAGVIKLHSYTDDTPTYQLDNSYN